MWENHDMIFIFGRSESQPYGQSREATEQGSKIWGHQRQKWTILLVKSCSKIVFNKQPISLASFLVTCMLFYLATWDEAPSAQTRISAILLMAVESQGRLLDGGNQWLKSCCLVSADCAYVSKKVFNVKREFASALKQQFIKPRAPLITAWLLFQHT